MAMEIHPGIAPLSYLLGTWRGQGEGGFPTINSFQYGEELHFSHSGKPFIAYSQKTWKLGSGEPMHAETGYWRPKPDSSIEVVIAQSTGLVEVQKGTYNAEDKMIKLKSELVGNASKESQFWKLYKEDQPTCSIVMRTSVGLVHLLACLLEPFMPSFTVEVYKQLNLQPEKQVSLCDEKGEIDRARRPWEIVPGGHKIGTPAPLFKELKDEEVEEFRKRFAGSQADRIIREEAAAAKIAAQLKKTKLSDGSGKKQRPTKSASEAKHKTTVEPEISIARLDIRVGKITKVQKHPDADSLYVEEIDVGEGQPRTVVSGLVKYIPLEEMQERMVCVLCNLKPAAMRGIKSHAMVLCASSSDHTKVELVEPPKSAKIGERVAFPGFEGEPDDVLNPKKKVWETVQVDLHTDAELVARYKDIPFTTSAGVCTVSSIQIGSIR